MVPTVMTQGSNFLVTPTFTCEKVFGYCATNYYTPLSADDYAQTLLRFKPEFLQSNDYVDFLYKELAMEKKQGQERKTIDFVQFTDIHVDFDYAVGSSVNCGDVLCCRKESGYPTDPAD